MNKPTFPRELASLVHHIHLNEAGWWDKGIRQLLIATLWVSSESLALADIVEDLHTNFEVDIDGRAAAKHVDNLCSADVLVRLPSGKFKITESALHAFETKLEHSEEICAAAKERFVTVLEEHCPTLDGDETWDEFNENFLLPLVRDIGANTYRLVSGGSPALYTTWLDEFLQGYSPEMHRGLHDAVVSFLNPHNSDVRWYVFRALNAYFFIEAGSLTDDTLQTLNKMTQLTPSFTVFVDTNVLFSVLGLDESPSNEAALLLMALIDKLAARANIKLFMLPPTVEEAKRVLRASRDSLQSLRVTANVAEAALGMGLTGIGRTFIEECRKSSSTLSAQDYFGPYISDLVSVARSKGVDVFNASLDDYRSNQHVVDDMSEQLNYEAQRFPNRPKNYGPLLHDMILWHFVRDKRPTYIESPLEAKYWIVTNDRRFCRFDAAKSRRLGNTVPVCVHPSTLTQMLQFWLPRSTEFEQALLGTIRMPLLLQEFDAQAEQVTLRIIEALGRFEEVGDIPTEAIASILVNKALRQRIPGATESEERIQLVRDTLIEEGIKLREELTEAERKAELFEREGTERQHTIDDLESRLGAQQADAQSKARLLRKTQARERELEEALDEMEGRRTSNKRIAAFVLKHVVAQTATVALVGAATYWLVARLTTGALLWPVTVGIWACLLLILVWRIDSKGCRDTIVKEWSPFRRFHRFKIWLFSAIGFIVLTVVSAAVWYYITVCFPRTFGG